MNERSTSSLAQEVSQIRNTTMMSRKFLTLVIVIALIAAPIALGSAMLDSEVGVLGAVVFGVFAFVVASIFPSRRWLAVSICGIVVLTVTLVLYGISANEITVENRSGQEISSIGIHPSNGNWSYRFAGLPDGLTGRFTVHNLFFDGRLSVNGSLRDGSLLQYDIMGFEQKSYHRRVRILIERDGKTHAVFE
jgi:hypothetical protein